MTVFEIVVAVAAVSLWVLAFVSLVRSNAGITLKLVWGALILLLPVVGSLVYFLAAPSVKEPQELDQDYELTHRPTG
jgi:phospholipase D-like protein